MPWKEGQLSLEGHFQMAPMHKIIKTRLFGGPYIFFSEFILVCSYLYESGAILGRAKCDKLTELVKMGVAHPGKETKVLRWLQKLAKERLDKFREESNSFYIFILSEILESVGLDLKDVKTLKKAADEKAFDEKWSVEKVDPLIKHYFLEGIAFGSLFPELTERMYRNAYENIDTDAWSKWRAYGLAIPEKPPVMGSFEEREKLVLLMVALYAQAYYPELLDPLDLRKIIEEEIEKSKGEGGRGFEGVSPLQTFLINGLGGSKDEEGFL